MSEQGQSQPGEMGFPAYGQSAGEPAQGFGGAIFFPHRIVLASSSPARKKLLESMGLEFECDAPEIDETPKPGEDPKELAERLALAKADAARERHPDAFVIGCDQVGLIESEEGGITLLDKPGDPERALAQLEMMSGKTVEFRDALAIRQPDGRLLRGFALSVVSMRKYTRDEAEAYLRMDPEAVRCCGSCRFEGLGRWLIDSAVSADHDALVGLPTLELVRLMLIAGARLL